MPASLSPTHLDALLSDMLEVCVAAGARVMQDYVAGGATRAKIEMKEGGSPVTSSDLAADALIGEALAARWPDIGYHSEERPESWVRAHHPDQAVFVCDPIDGTRSYLSGGTEWCISLALVLDGRAIAGVIYAPARRETFNARKGAGATWNGSRLVPVISMPTRPVGSGPRTLLDQCAPHFADGLQHGPRLAALAYRLIAPLTGQIDLAAARPGAHDWDIAAADCILREAGGAIAYLNGDRPAYALDGLGHPAMIGGLSPVLRQAITLPERAAGEHMH